MSLVIIGLVLVAIIYVTARMMLQKSTNTPSNTNSSGGGGEAATGKTQCRVTRTAAPSRRLQAIPCRLEGRRIRCA